MSTYNIGSVSGQGNVFGDHGQVSNQFAASVTVNRALERVRSAVRDNAGEVADPEEMERITGELEEELVDSEPDRSRISRLLRQLWLGAGTVAAVTEALEGLESVIPG